MRRKFSTVIMISMGILTLALVAGCSIEDESKAEVGQVNQEAHEHGDYEWIGEFEFEAGNYLFHFGESKDKTMDVGFIGMGSNIADLEHHASHLMVSEKEVVKQDSTFKAKPDYAYTLEMARDHGHINFTVEEKGRYAIVTEHMPEESNMQVFDENNVELLPEKEHTAEGQSH